MMLLILLRIRMAPATVEKPLCPEYCRLVLVSKGVMVPLTPETWESFHNDKLPHGLKGSMEEQAREDTQHL